MDEKMQEMYDQGKRTEELGKSMQSAGGKMYKAGCGMQLGCLCIVLLFLLLVAVLIR